MTCLATKVINYESALAALAHKALHGPQPGDTMIIEAYINSARSTAKAVEYLHGVLTLSGEAPVCLG